MSQSSISLTGVTAGYPNPGTLIQINFAQGPAAGGAGPRPILVMGNKTSAGSATVGTVVYGPTSSPACQTETDVIALFGTGSQLHRWFLRFTAINQVTPIFFVVVATSVGSSASGTLTFVGTATAVGNGRVFMGDQFVDFTINVGDTPTTQATNCVAAILTQTRWPITATSAAGVVTATAVNAGPEGNWINLGAVITSQSTITTTVAPTAPTLLTGGTTADTIATALSTIQAARYYNIAVCDSDATNVGLAATQINTQALPLNGKRQRLFCGYSGTLANAITFATGLNAPRAEIALVIGADITPLEASANNAAIFTLLENQAVPRHNFSLFPALQSDQTLWQLVATRNGPGAGLTPSQITSALLNGLTPYAVLPSGALQLVKRITSYSLNGSVQDPRVRDACKVYENDYFCDDAAPLIAQNYGGMDLINNPPAGATVPQGGNVFWPRTLGNDIESLVEQYGNNGRFQNVPAILATMVTQRSPVNRNRCEVRINTQVVDVGDQFALQVNQVG